MKILDNGNNTVRDDLRIEIKRGSRVSVAAACFSMYACRELKVGLKKLKQALDNSQDKGTERGSKVAYSEYRDLTPIDSIENGDEYKGSKLGIPKQEGEKYCADRALWFGEKQYY